MFVLHVFRRLPKSLVEIRDQRLRSREITLSSRVKPLAGTRELEEFRRGYPERDGCRGRPDEQTDLDGVATGCSRRVQ